MVVMRFWKTVSSLLFQTVIVSALWPLPQKFEHGSTVLWVHDTVDIIYKPLLASHMSSWNKCRQYLKSQWDSSAVYKSPARSTDNIVDAAIERTRNTLSAESFVPWKFHPRNADFEPPLNVTRRIIDTIVLTVNPDTFEQAASEESYTLQIPENGSVILNAKSEIGVLRGLTTFVQLFYKHSQADNGRYTPLAPVDIEDFPAFEHRGLNLDISRNYISPDDVIRTLGAMSLQKLNRLHLHASDAQSWPLEIPSLPDLAAKGAYRPDLIWTPNDLLRVQEFGRYQGIEVYLEIDLPGHTASIAEAYPSLIIAYNSQPSWQTYSAEPPSGQLRLNSSAVPPFLHTLLSDLLPRTAPFSPLFHTGGDEINLAAYSLDPHLNTSSPHTLLPLLQSLVTTTHALTRAHHLTPLVWEELLLDLNLTLGPDVIVQTWRSPAALAATVARGHRALFGDCHHWYLDCGVGAWLDPRPANATPLRPPYRDYCSPYKNWRYIYSYDPLALVPDGSRGLVLGGEVHLWGELTDGVGLDGKLWPRAAAAAEVLWRGGGRTVDEGATRRLAEMRERLVGRGVIAEVVQMTWCLMNEGGCRL
ncbi:MAG: glycoside hydrolase family 20 [Lasallia pustulata]|uniref:Beta-hexosaminidase n=1 Tax=Lasallia pustulata TaxID=136370 RepID=A0A5M8PVM6_9LECA|nr:MAG: glycoside hydrolase family 20 [Lasallia pustulata]